MPSTIKKARYSDEPVFVISDGTHVPYIPPEIITNRGAYGASLHLLFKHIADFHMLMIEILAEKTGLDSTEIVEVIQNDQRYKDIIVHPTIHAMTLVTREDVEKHIPLEAPVQHTVDPNLEEVTKQVSAISLAPETVPQPVAPKKVKKMIVKKKVSE
jgi:hypothetical protein